jgi:hypothetical protein
MSGDDPTGSAVKSGAGILGVGAVACVACCAGPILGALSAIGVATAVGYAIAGGVALVLGAAAVAWVVLHRRRRRQRACARERVTFVASPTVGPSTEPSDEQAKGPAGDEPVSPGAAGERGSERPGQPAREPTPG